MIAVASSSRADWGLLTPLVAQLARRSVGVSILASNMHLVPKLGLTVNEIEAAGYDPVKLATAGENPDGTFANSALLHGRWFAGNRPEAVVILGDRYEMLAVASAALMHNVPIVHIAGGTVSEGAFDNAVRNAISQLASLHLVETDLCAGRLAKMGIDRENIFVTGALGVWNALNVPLMTRSQLEDSLGRTLPRNFFVATLHAATLSGMPPGMQMSEFLAGLDGYMKIHDEYGAIVTYPNNDTDPVPLISQLRAFEREHPSKIVVVPSLGMKRYLSAVAVSAGVIGNSSSGVVEVASLGVPTLDIGIRQRGRERAGSVVHCDGNAASVAEGLELITSDEVRNLSMKRENPYFRADTPAVMAEIIRNFKFNGEN